jgi:hypothetical protein
VAQADGNVGIGTSSPVYLVDLTFSDSTLYTTSSFPTQNNNLRIFNSNATVGTDASILLRTGGDTSSNNAHAVISNVLTSANNSALTFKTENSGTLAERLRIDASGNVGIGTTSPTAELTINGGATSTDVRLQNTNSGSGAGNGLDIGLGSTGDNGYIYLYENGYFYFATNATERMRIDSSGNLLVGHTGSVYNNVNVTSTEGISLTTNGEIFACSSESSGVMILNRKSTDGAIASFRKDGSTVGSILNDSTAAYFNSTADGGLARAGTVYFKWSSAQFYPNVDDSYDLGIASRRFDDIYATNATIQTSDRNEKQDIESLSEAEQRVAIAAKGLLRKFRWKSAVEEKGDDARIHFGIIAQDLQAAFEAEGLDAGRYAMFIHSTWTDEETGEERSRMGVRYSELLAFIIAAL